MTRPVRTHGTRSCYVGGCRRPECVEAQREYGRHYYQTYRKATEGVPHVPAARALAHVKRLRAAGMGKKLIADAAGLSTKVIDHLYKTRRGIRPETERAVLSVRLTTFLVDSAPSCRRVRALARLGWTSALIADTAGIDQKVVLEVSAARRPTITRTNADAIATAYERLSMRLGPSERARQRAQFKGWAPPLAYDDIDADEAPVRSAKDDEHMDEIAIARAVDRGGVQLTRAERVEVVRRMAAAGFADPAIAAHTNVNRRTVERIRKDHDIPSRVGSDWRRAS